MSRRKKLKNPIKRIIPSLGSYKIKFQGCSKGIGLSFQCCKTPEKRCLQKQVKTVGFISFLFKVLSRKK
jgi:hypothetical protein